MIVVFDTTETFATPTFRGAKWEKIGRFFKNQQHRGIIPQIVLEETLNHIQEQLVKLTHEHRDISRKLTDLCVEEGRWRRTDKVGEVNWRPVGEGDVRQRLQQLGLSVVEYSDCSLQSIVMRALQRKKPFDNKGERGFRDAILWDTIKRVLIESSDQLSLITRNTSDFFCEGKLHPQLASELVEFGCSGRADVYNGIDPFVAEVVDPTLERANHAIDSMRNRTYQSLDPVGFIDQHLDEIEDTAVSTLAKSRFRIQTRYGHDIVEEKLVTPMTVHHVTCIDAYHTDATLLAVSVQFELTAVIEAQLVLELDEGLPPYYEPAALKVLFSFTGSLLVDEQSQSVVESAFTCDDISSTRDPSPSFLNLPNDSTPRRS